MVGERSVSMLEGAEKTIAEGRALIHQFHQSFPKIFDFQLFFISQAARIFIKTSPKILIKLQNLVEATIFRISSLISQKSRLKIVTFDLPLLIQPIYPTIFVNWAIIFLKLPPTTSPKYSNVSEGNKFPELLF